MKIIRESLYIRLLKYRREPASFVLLTLLPTTFYVFFALQAELRNRLQSFKQKTDEGKLHDG